MREVQRLKLALVAKREHLDADVPDLALADVQHLQVRQAVAHRKRLHPLLFDFVVMQPQLGEVGEIFRAREGSGAFTFDLVVAKGEAC